MLAKTDIQLIDFGSATFEHEYHSSVVSTRHYRAPEIILGTGWSYPCDMWSVGCVLYELFTGDALFQTREDIEHLAMMEEVLGAVPSHLIQKASREAQAYFDEDGKVRFPTPKTTARDLKYFEDEVRPLKEKIVPDNSYNLYFLDLVQRMLVYDPERRITPRQALRHPFFKIRFDENGDVIDNQGPANTTTSRRSM